MSQVEKHNLCLPDFSVWMLLWKLGCGCGRKIRRCQGRRNFTSVHCHRTTEPIFFDRWWRLKGQSWHKKGGRLRVHESNIIFHIKIWLSYLIKLSFKNYIFIKWAYQNTSFPSFYGSILMVIKEIKFIA